MSTNLRYYLVIAAAVGACLLLFAYLIGVRANPGSDNGVTRIYFVDNMSLAQRTLVQRFNDEYRGRIEVVPVNLPFEKFSTNERKELLARSLRSKGDRIDVFTVDLIWIPRFARWAEPLDAIFSTNERAQLLDYALSSCYADSHLVAIPFYIDIGLMYYRRDLLSSYPDAHELEKRLERSLTWDEFIELGRNNPFPEKPFYLYSAKAFEGLVCSFVEGVFQQNGSILQQDSVNLVTPEAERTLQLLVDLVGSLGLTPDVVTEFDEVQVQNYALEHDALFFRGWPGLLSRQNYDGNIPHIDKLRMAPLPHFAGGDAASVYGGWNLMISRFSSRKTAAFEFVRFAMRPENQTMMFVEACCLPVNRAVYQDSAFNREYPELADYRLLLDRGVHRPVTENYTGISDVVSYFVRRAIRGEIGVSQALRQATDAINSQRVFVR